MSTLSQKQKRFLKQQAHHLPVTVTVGGNGLTSGVINELNITLEHHELIKVKIPAMPKEDKKQLIELIETKCQAQAVQLIGRIGVFYKAPEDLAAGKDAKIKLPKD